MIEDKVFSELHFQGTGHMGSERAEDACGWSIPDKLNPISTVLETTLSKRRTTSAVRCLDSQALFQMTPAVARDAQHGFLFAFQPHQYAAVDVREQLLHEADVRDRRAVNPHE